ncbi:RluA family pseudouridine synthase [Candidatus Nanosynbacter sp. TM7-087]|uniref:RluA family pseudouridine synthase n=1 Tax=Candidatus Nanosynbacter sp. TM7-087 TaxID=2902631 RepID=UPI001FB79BBF|nr:RluA family pseudouridine synthase [Candidatus Nanosynbacter sp. TM7-087]MCJ1966256.1 RluA family pseudouridine synthase [Candidatus Nanosynbacter sp. TM7-087]
MKILPRTVLKIARLYKLADDNTPVKALRRLEIQTDKSHVFADFILNKQHFALLYGSIVDEESIDELWTEKPDNAEILPNPLDPEFIETPFQGKYVIMFKISPTKVRLDIYLSTKFDTTISRSLWQKYIKAGYVSVNNKVATTPKFEVDETDEIALNLPEKEQADVDLPILYENDDVIVVNKPSGLLTHAKGGLSDEPTVAEIIRPKTSFATDTDRPGIVHRLDRDTSGLLIIAKNPESAAHLQRQFAERTTKKTYIAITDGKPKLNAAKIDLPIGRNPSAPSTFRIDPNGKPAQTTYHVLAENDAQSLVELKPTTGRTHQLRVHLAHLNAPILGDRVYGKSSDCRMMLHAQKLEITLPSGERKVFEAIVPDEFKRFFPEDL